MSLRDVIEYRVADSRVVSLSIDDMPRVHRTLYSRPWGCTEWGYHSGEMYFDDEYRASHEAASHG